jgi:hypothetical protein
MDSRKGKFVFTLLQVSARYTWNLSAWLCGTGEFLRAHVSVHRFALTLASSSRARIVAATSVAPSRCGSGRHVCACEPSSVLVLYGHIPRLLSVDMRQALLGVHHRQNPKAESMSYTAGPVPRPRADMVEPGRASGRFWFGLPVLLLVSHAVLAWIGRMPGLVGAEDDARYLLLARSLQRGTYRELWSPGLPLHHMYPPGYPALLAVWTAIGGQGLDWIILLQIIMDVTALWLMFVTVRIWMPAVVSICALAIAALNPEVIKLAGQVMSEPALMLCVTLSVWAAASREGRPERTAIMIGAALLAPFFRSEGIVVPIALVATFLLQGRWGTLPLAIAAACILGPLLYWNLHNPSGVIGTSYAADLTRAGRSSSSLPAVLLKRGFSNALYYALRGVPYIFPMPGVVKSVVARSLDALIIFSGLAVGIFVSFRRFRLGALILLACGGMFLVWPWQLVRYLVPFLTIVIPLSTLGLFVIGRRFVSQAPALLLYGVTALALLTGASHNLEQIGPLLECRRGGPYPDESCVGADSRKMFRALKIVVDSLPPDASVLASKGATLYYYTGRKGERTVNMTELDSVQFWSTMGKMGIDYVLVGDYLPDRAALPVLETRCASLQPIGEVPYPFHLFRVQRSATPMGSASDSTSPGCVALRRSSVTALMSGRRPTTH